MHILIICLFSDSFYSFPFVASFSTLHALRGLVMGEYSNKRLKEKNWKHSNIKFFLSKKNTIIFSTVTWMFGRQVSVNIKCNLFHSKEFNDTLQLQTHFKSDTILPDCKKAKNLLVIKFNLYWDWLLLTLWDNILK